MVNTNYWNKKDRALKFLGGKCNHCNSTEDLEIDHIIPLNYKYAKHSICALSEEKFLIELNKCQLLCHNCHTLKSLKDQGFERITTETHNLSRYRFGCRCDICKEAKSSYMRNYRNQRSEKQESTTFEVSNG